MDKAELLHRIHTERGRFEAALAGWSDEELARPGACGEWSAADLLGHIAAWEERMLRCVARVRQGLAPDLVAYGLPGEVVDRLNHEIYLAQRGRPPAEVRAQSQRSYEETLRTVEAIPEADLALPVAVEGVGAVPLWEVVAANTSEHYAEHLDSLQAPPGGPATGGGSRP